MQTLKTEAVQTGYGLRNLMPNKYLLTKSRSILKKEFCTEKILEHITVCIAFKYLAKRINKGKGIADKWDMNVTKS